MTALAAVGIAAVPAGVFVGAWLLLCFWESRHKSRSYTERDGKGA